MRIKICGITREREIAYLNNEKVDYAGFVIFEKSKRYVTVERAKELFKELDNNIKKVAVVVSPDVKLAQEIEKAGFDIIQIHKELKPEVVEALNIPIWYAYNISKSDEIVSVAKNDKIKAFVVDGAEYGSGKTFDWNTKVENSIFDGREFVLAGGLNASNVVEGIKLFNPDIVDVSSGVEGDDGKDEQLIKGFVERVRTNE